MSFQTSYVTVNTLASVRAWLGIQCQAAPPALDSHTAEWREATETQPRRMQHRAAWFSFTCLKLEMADGKWFAGAASGVGCDPRTSEEEEKLTEDSEKRWEIPSLQDLEKVLQSAPHSCHHGDEVWPNLYLGDMWVSCGTFIYTCLDFVFNAYNLYQVYVSWQVRALAAGYHSCAECSSR